MRWLINWFRRKFKRYPPIIGGPVTINGVTFHFVATAPDSPNITNCTTDEQFCFDLSRELRS